MTGTEAQLIATKELACRQAEKLGRIRAIVEDEGAGDTEKVATIRSILNER